MSTDGKEPINPDPTDRLEWTGLTKREYFAIKILQGIESNPDPHIGAEGTGKTSEQIAVERADKLIEELNKD